MTGGLLGSAHVAGWSPGQELGHPTLLILNAQIKSELSLTFILLPRDLNMWVKLTANCLSHAAESGRGTASPLLVWACLFAYRFHLGGP